MQRTLNDEQIEAFYHDCFIDDQVGDFLAMVPPSTGTGLVADLGGGCGFFAKLLMAKAKIPVRVLDTDKTSVATCIESNVDALISDALSPNIKGDEEVACFNLILHHLVADREDATRQLQMKALRAWLGHARFLFVNEYIYESLFANLSGGLIYGITKSRVLSAMGKTISKVIPSFKANTFGVGVRFRGHQEWVQLFEEAGYEVIDRRLGEPEVVPLPWRLLLIKTIRRDSFLMRPKPNEVASNA